MQRQLLLLTVVAMLAPGIASLDSSLTVSLSHVSTLYLPAVLENGSSAMIFNGMAVEQLALDVRAKIIYGVGNRVLHVINASDVTQLSVIRQVVLSDLDLTDVEMCGEGVMVTYRNNSDKRQGGVLVFRTYDADTGELPQLWDIPMGSLPDMLSISADCSTAVVAVENEAFVQGGQFYDPPGGVGIIRFPSGIDHEPETKILNFTKFDDRFEQLSQAGVRWVYRGNNSFSDNIEPEYVAFNGDYTKAYIVLQENNAIAEVDLVTDNITDIHGLSFKTWGEMDPSDRDDGIHIQPWPLRGLYLPDSMHLVTWNDQQYLITANEGDAMEYDDPVNFSEVIRGGEINVSHIADTVSEDVRQALQDDTRLGRLTFSNVDGKNNEGKFEQFYAYGGRSFSIWRTSDMARVYDSASEMEKQTAEDRPDVFNCNSKAGDLVADTLDLRSDDKGPETESLAVGQASQHLLIFAGNERPGTIAVYSVAPGGLTPQFQYLYTDGIPQGSSRTWGQMYHDGDLHAIDPEFLRFFPQSDGLADYPVLLVGGAVSGTVSILRVHVDMSDTGAVGEGASVMRDPGVWRVVVLGVLLLQRCLY